MDSDLEVIYKAANAQQAAILKNILEEEGIDSTVTNLALMGGAGELPVGWSSAPCILVRQEDYERAKVIAEQFDHDLSHATSSSLNNDSKKSSTTATDTYDDELDSDSLDPTWPPCPACAEPRRGRCSHCGAFDAYFSPAEYMVTDRRGHEDPSSGAESFKVESPEDHFMCSVCDEAMLPEPLRYCQSCGNDFGEGLVLSAPERAESNPRVTITIAVLIAIGLAGLLYVFIMTR